MKATKLSLLAAAAALCLLSTQAAFAQKKYDTGASDTEIKIGNIMPYSGPASAYGIIGKTEAAYFKKINAEGGINGRKITFVTYDDAYSPPRAVEQVRKLVESDEKFKVSPQILGITVGTLGYGVVLLVGDAIQTFIDAINELLGKKLPPVASWPLAIAGGGALLILVGDQMVVRRFAVRVSRQAQELDREFMRGADQPKRPERSGSPDSAVDWNTMGRQGRAVVAGGPRKEDIERLLDGGALEPIRIFVGLDTERDQAPDFEEMAAVAIKEMHRTGAFERSHIAVMSAAGTGWPRSSR